MLEGIFCVKLMQLILFSLALDLTSVFLLLELHFLDHLEQAETIGEEGRVKGESILFFYTPSLVSKISTQEHTGLHLHTGLQLQSHADPTHVTPLIIVFEPCMS